jgi:hypothetical protein
MVGLHDLYEFELVPDADGTISTEKWTQIEHAPRAKHAGVVISETRR